ncbi:MAG: DNA gyrase subunit A [Clostridia bacterium]|nr:DNA gyrase subunit A [Clostridia bacterium]
MRFENQKIVDVVLEKELKKSFMEYTMSVIVGRALPDVRDGLKPVHRRILYAMYEDGLTADKPYRKSATTVGNVLGRYHPHGDAAVYDTMVRLAQPFSLRYPLVDGHGNFGSVDGDPPAAYRYTEARMARLADALLADIDKNTVDFAPNFDNALTEPVVLPSRFPNLLVNGSMGIAVGMATNMPPHNLREVIDAIVHVIDHPEADFEELMQFIKGPDFPTGGIIMGMAGIRQAYATGRGRITVRAKTEIEETKDGRFRIIVTELPYQVNKSRLIAAIADLYHNKELEGLSDINDESGRDGMRIVIDLKRGANAGVVLNQLFHRSQLQDTFSIINLTICDRQPKILTLRELIDQYVIFQDEVIRRRTAFDLDKAEKRAHLLEGLRIAIANIEEVVAIIRSSASIADAKTRLSERFLLTEVQAQYIVDMTLGKLTNLETKKIEDEYAAVMAKIALYREILADDNRIRQIVMEELIELRDKYGDDRRTAIEPIEGEIDMEDLIPRESCVITMTHRGYIKRQTTDTYRSQRRGGRGISAMATKEDDFVKELFVAGSHDHVLFFTNTGRVFRKKAYELPEASRTSKGTFLANLLELQADEKITSMIRVPEENEGLSLTTLTRRGIIKRTLLSEYNNIRRTGLIAVSLDEGDELVEVRLTEGDMDLIVATRMGKAIRFREGDVRLLSRGSRGVRAIKLSDDDEVVGMSEVREGHTLMTITSNGYGKRVEFDEYPSHHRSGQGTLNCRPSDKLGTVAAIRAVSEEDDIVVVTDGGVIIRTAAAQIPVYSRTASGVIVMRPDEGTQVVSLARIRPEPEVETEAGEEGEAEETAAAEE